ncbi:hypothetical protein WICPIJ_007165 [Wickerhamomyces pijperi]|uniref:ubiquitinyl hydrolase 1 n=1 Tax=Wickerhamomyces pijperi TaxID=599730 RepID=A0A9P8TK82_WICPI|nr:hypothetical protein WICPIJ_007165 [Wickerhamomyces pijperi]
MIVMNVNTSSNNPFLKSNQEGEPTDQNQSALPSQPPPPQQEIIDLTLSGTATPVNEAEPIEQDQKEKQDDIIPNIYENLESSVFKTTNRIIDDLKVLLLLGKKDSSILRSHPIEYSQDVAHMKYNPFIFNVLDQTPVENKVDVRKSFDNPQDEVITLRGLIYNGGNSQLSQFKLYHVRMVVKSKHSHRAIHVTKNEYYLVKDEDLSESDKKDLILSEVLDETKNNYATAQKSLPVLVDSATFVCSKTQKMFRVEISEPEFSFEDLHDFELGPINVRYHQALAKFPDLDPNNVPSPAECLSTLFKTLRGPLLQPPSSETQSIIATNKALNTKLNPKLLLNKLHFKFSEDKYVPVNFSDHETDSNSLVIRESFTKKVNECLLLGTKAYSAQRPNPFREFKFTSELSTVFESLQDNASITHHRDVLKDPYYINISAYPFYSDELIIKCYNNTVNSDAKNLPSYFDCIHEISNLKSTARINQFFNGLSRAGILGQKEIDAAYRRLLGQADGSLADDDTIISAYQMEVLQSSSDHSRQLLRTSLEVVAKMRQSAKLTKFLAYELMPIDKAYELLGIEYPDEITDDVIPTLVQMKKDDLADRAQEVDRAFITVASERKSAFLLNIVELEFPDIIEPMDFTDACRELAVDKDHAEDIQIIEIFKNVTLSNQLEIKRARCALRVIGEHKDSDLIRQYLTTGNLDSSLIDSYEWPVGLNNIGNTCYLNSILQYLFSVKPVREFVLNFNGALEETEKQKYLDRTLGGSKLTPHQLVRSFQFVYRLQDLYKQMVETPERVVSPSKELAFLVFLRFEDLVDFISTEEDSKGLDLDLVQLGDNDVPDLCKDVGSDESNSANSSAASSSSMTDDIDSDLEIVEKPVEAMDSGSVAAAAAAAAAAKEEEEDIVMVLPAEPENNTQNVVSDTDGDIDLVNDPAKPQGRQLLSISEQQMNGIDANTQQDAQECLSNVILQIEAVIPPDEKLDGDREQVDFFKDLFFGKMLQRLVSLTDKSDVRTKKEMFANLIVNVQTEPRTLYDGLDETFGTEQVEILSSYRDKFERIIDLPTILQIQFQRVFYDREAFTLKKNNHGIQYPQELYMDRYMDTSDPVLIGKREESSKLKTLMREQQDRLDSLRAVDDNGLTLRESLLATRAWLTEMDEGSENLLSELDKKIEEIPKLILELNQQIEQLQRQIDHCFDDYKELAYTLFAVFIHKGEASYGHYWIYLNDIEKGYFRKYNDENVTRASENDVFDFSSKDKTTAYFLGYVRKGHEKDIEALVRCKVEETDLMEL